VKDYAAGHPNACGCYNCRLSKGDRFVIPIMPDTTLDVLFREGGLPKESDGIRVETWVLREMRKLYDTVYYYEKVR
jgi:hypothetical protein